MCDHSLGRVLDAMDQHDLWDDTMLIVCTDHGFLLGEHGWWGKNVQPWYDEIIHTPLFVWDPRVPTPRANAAPSLVQTIDLAPDAARLLRRPPGRRTCRAYPCTRTVVDDTPVREAGLFGSFGGHVNVTDGRYVYMRACAEASEPAAVRLHADAHPHAEPVRPRATSSTRPSHPPFDFTKGVPVLRIPAEPSANTYAHGSLLFDLATDPGQERPLVDDAVETRLAEAMVASMRACDTPPEQFTRLGLPARGPVGPEHLLLRRQQEQARVATTPLPDPDEHPTGRFTLRTPVSELLAEPAAVDAIQAAVPGLLDNPRVATFGHLSLLELAAVAPAVLDGVRLRLLATALATA